MTTTLPRATVEQALEALKLLSKRVKTGYDGMPQGYGVRASDEAITALRSALAQQAEPVEPVAWYDGKNFYGTTEAASMNMADMRALRPVYTAPPQRQPLTEKEAAALIELDPRMWREFGTAPSGAAMELIRRTERAHDIKVDVRPRQAEPAQALNAWAADRLARHGIKACLYPQCVGGQSGTVCHKHCPTPCTDCRGVGYDSSGQLCACQQNPSF